MRKLYPLVNILFVTVVIAMLASSSGSPGGRTGSPGDGEQNCSGCHFGSTTQVEGWISTEVPAAGYIPGETYLIAATGTHTGVVKFGFELTAEDENGNKTGTLTLADPNTKLTNNEKAVTHSATGTTPNGNTKTWVVEWTAPEGEENTIGFYAAFNAANGNGANTGDVIYLSKTFVHKNMSGLYEREERGKISIQPNPSSGIFKLYAKPGNTIGHFAVFNLFGRLIMEGSITSEKTLIDLTDHPEGIYFLRTICGNSSGTIRLVKK